MSRSGIHISQDHPRYWEYDGEPVLLLGGSSQDNLFQVPGVEHQLDLLADLGGNYVRNTMSARNRRESPLRWGADNVWPFAKRDDGAYDLEEWNDAYWERFDSFLQETEDRDIVVQIEVWATFDYYGDSWKENPFNPKNNVNYSADASGLPEVVDATPGETGSDVQPFFWSVPAERNLSVILEYQKQFVDHVLEHTFEHDHILYCMDNETKVTPVWGAYWADYVRERAEGADEEVYLTEMWLSHEPDHEQHEAVTQDPERYDFVEASQNNHNTGREHYENAIEFRKRATDPERPVNNVKVYGNADRGGFVEGFGSEQDGVERFWRNIFAGMASSRFHRPPYGIGINARAQRMLRSARAVTEELDFFTCAPRDDLLSDRRGEAYVLADPGQEYAVYFPTGGAATLTTSDNRDWSVEWYDVEACQWQDAGSSRDTSEGLVIETPYEKQWVAVVQ